MHNNIMAAGSRDHPPMLASRTLCTMAITKEVNEIRVEKIARNAIPLARVAAAQQYPDTYYQAPKSHKSYAPTSKQLSFTRSHETTRHKGKKIAKPITPPSKSAFKEDSDLEQAQRDKDMQKNLALIAKYFKKIYKPTNNNLRTSSNTREKNVDTSETKRAKDYTYHKEKMLLCKQVEKYVSLQAEQTDWLEDTLKEVNKQELEAHYIYMEKIQEVHITNSRPSFDAEPLEKVHSDDENNVFANEKQHSEQPVSINNTCVVEKVDSNVIPDSLDIDLQGNNLLTAKASPTQAWLWHQRLSHLNSDYINLLSKKDIMIGLPKLKYVKDQLCSSCEAEAISTAYYTQTRSVIISTLEKTAYHILIDRKPSIRHLHIFGCTCYLIRDSENLYKMKEKGDPCILVGYSTQSKGYRVYNKRTRLIVESIHVRFDEIKEMSEMSVDNNTSGLGLKWVGLGTIMGVGFGAEMEAEIEVKRGIEWLSLGAKMSVGLGMKWGLRWVYLGAEIGDEVVTFGAETDLASITDDDGTPSKALKSTATS
nr:retrovirus-related Pol polyprotein from transposon TNT 1-94 [Tanacetum cinerariifolium]